MQPIAAQVSNPTRHVQALLDAARALGGTVETTRTKDCYLSVAVYGTPSYRHFYSHEEKRWVTQEPINDVTRHVVRWALHTPKDRCWEQITTGPTVFELMAAMGLTTPERRYAGANGADAEDRGKFGIHEMVIYEHDTLTARNGSEGRGIMIAVTSRPSTASRTDQRGCYYFATDADGALKIGKTPNN